ncbi:tyrosinase family protein [Frankia sp. AgPm24]|uniref:tyrosinase family protein n=1 Tax=Frankia sp. AgPm24 TaxID=631128 RepID=UPI00200E933C|nr:tyrosinase family protein [Frankia sp. AgPm24]MCK9922693.1 tyrosinase family protein [Frankia sp. AgPm24]
MANIRSNVWELGSTWADPILWYARGVAALRARPITNPTSWRFYAGIHGFNSQLWQQLGYLSPTEQLPSSALRGRFWAQCQHASWYFLPWHRGYLYAFEDNIRAAVVSLGGPANWALPYWNYFKPGENAIPPAFAQTTWPDGGANPLFVQARYGPTGNGQVSVPLSRVDLNAMNEPVFTGVTSGGSPGFGGVDTGFSHSGSIYGRLENQPHNMVHTLVGGRSGNQPGAMAVPDSAGLDPIFWLHHANIDRLWESWNRSSPTHLNPTSSRWLSGPAANGRRPFAMPWHDGTTWTFTPAQLVSIQRLGYQYSDLAPALIASPPAEPAQRLVRLGISAPVPVKGTQPVPEETRVELVGATTDAVLVRGGDVRSHVHLDSGMRRKVTASLSGEPPTPDDHPSPRTPATPDRVFLNLENVRGRSDTSAFDVYVGVPDDQDPATHPDRLAGSVSPFGLRKASTPDGDHAGQGLTFVLEITDIVDQLHLDRSFDVDSLPVRIVPISPIADDANLSIGRISVFRDGL